MSAAESVNAIGDFTGGVQLSRHIDLSTAELDNLARVWIRMQRERKALDQQGAPDEIVKGFDKLEKRASTLVTRSLRKHSLWPWLSQFPGLGGAHSALIIGRIGDPRRFPGQRCTEGHYLPADVYEVGTACPVAVHGDEFDVDVGGGQDSGAAEPFLESDATAGCSGVLLPPRPGTGVRSVWHWAGLHADAEGRAPRRRKGVKSDWEPRVRSSVMQPGGIAEQIVRLNVPHYADVYRETKARLTLRIPEVAIESGPTSGDANNLRAADHETEIEVRVGGTIQLRAAESPAATDAQKGRPLRPYEADRIARKVAAKAFLGDLLIEWKRIA